MTRRRKKEDTEKIKRSLALGYRRSKSLSNLKSFDVDTNPFTGQVRRHKPDFSASCSALDLPLPPKPVQMSTLYEDKYRHSDFLSVNENVAYTTNESPPPYSKNPQQSHVYEQIDQDLLQSTAF